LKLAGGKKTRAPASRWQDDLKLIKELFEDGKIRAVIDKVFSIDDAAEAHRYSENKVGKGKAVIHLTTQKIQTEYLNYLEKNVYYEKADNYCNSCIAYVFML
jgi:aryl-alcohol dehydrogenase-like predicted oxidoreductase